jgi:cytidine deaminase
MLAEFCTDLEILLVSSAGKKERTRLATLLPNAFRWKGAPATAI